MDLWMMYGSMDVWMYGCMDATRGGMWMMYVLVAVAVAALVAVAVAVAALVVAVAVAALVATVAAALVAGCCYEYVLR